MCVFVVLAPMPRRAWCLKHTAGLPLHPRASLLGRTRAMLILGGFPCRWNMISPMDGSTNTLQLPAPCLRQRPLAFAILQSRLSHAVGVLLRLSRSRKLHTFGLKLVESCRNLSRHISRLWRLASSPESRIRLR